MTALDDIAAERRRQIAAEGFDAQHDDNYPPGTLALAGAVYALPNAEAESLHGSGVPVWLAFWPWDREWLRKGDRRRDLVKAAALIVAEIDRLDRSERQGGGDAEPR
jgi:hypothetical protein